MSASYPPRTFKPSLAVQTNNSPQLNSSTANWTSSEINESTTSPSTNSPLIQPLSDSVLSSNNNHNNNINQKNNNNNLNPNPTSNSTSTTSLSSSSSSSSSQAIFTQLQKIKTLQKEIADSHSTLEGIGNKQQFWYKDGNISSAATGDQEDKDAGKEGMKLSYEEMAKEFAERQENVEDIMNKVSILFYLL